MKTKQGRKAKPKSKAKMTDAQMAKAALRMKSILEKMASRFDAANGAVVLKSGRLEIGFRIIGGTAKPITFYESWRD